MWLASGQWCAENLRRWCPNIITAIGHALTVAWLLGAPLWVGVIGLLCDDLDGYAARKLGVASVFGSQYDWTVDVTLAAVVLDRLGLLPLAVLAVPLQVRARLAGRKVCGRAALSALLAVVMVVQAPGVADGGSGGVPVEAAELGGTHGLGGAGGAEGG